MAVILVDYENVNATDGLKGLEYLNEKDELIIFYSQCCKNIRADYIELIEKSNCDFKIYELVKSGKNALDFYITVEQARIKEHKEFVNRIIKLFEETEYREKITSIIKFIESPRIKTNRCLYTSSLHTFGREEGRAIYRILKEVV